MHGWNGTGPNSPQHMIEWWPISSSLPLMSPFLWALGNVWRGGMKKSQLGMCILWTHHNHTQGIEPPVSSNLPDSKIWNWNPHILTLRLVSILQALQVDGHRKHRSWMIRPWKTKPSYSKSLDFASWFHLSLKLQSKHTANGDQSKADSVITCLFANLKSENLRLPLCALQLEWSATMNNVHLHHFFAEWSSKYSMTLHPIHQEKNCDQCELATIWSTCVFDSKSDRWPLILRMDKRYKVNLPKFDQLRASPPCRVEGNWQALWRGLGEKTAPPLSNPAALIARALQTSGSAHYPPGWALLLLRPHSGASSTCVQWIVPLLGIK